MAPLQRDVRGGGLLGVCSGFHCLRLQRTHLRRERRNLPWLRLAECGWARRFSIVGPGTRSISITWELVRYSDTKAPPQTYCINFGGWTAQLSVFEEPSRWFWCMGKFETHWVRLRISSKWYLLSGQSKAWYTCSFSSLPKQIYTCDHTIRAVNWSQLAAK